MTIYPLSSGNNIEKDVAPIFSLYFPKYEPYRSEYLVPLTGIPNDPNWRNDSHPELEKIGIASFGILKSINFINKKKNQVKVSGDPDQTFKNIYFHFGLAIDCVDALARAITMVESILGIIVLDERLALSKENLMIDFDSWSTKKYPMLYKDMISEGKPIIFYPHHDHNFFSIIVTDKSIRKKYIELVRRIKDYRNFFIHNPGVDVFMNNHTKKRYAIKKEMVDKSKNWATLRELYSIDKSLFIDPEEMITNDLTNLLKEFDSIWTFISENMKIIYSHDNFMTIFKGFDRNLILTTI